MQPVPIATIGTPVTPGIWGIIRDEDVAFPVSTTTELIKFLETRQASFSFTSVGQPQSFAGGRGPRMSKGWSSKKAHGRQRWDTEHVGHVTSLPVQDSYFHIWYSGVPVSNVSGETNDPAGITFIVKIDYWAVLSDRQELPVS